MCAAKHYPFFSESHNQFHFQYTSSPEKLDSLDHENRDGNFNRMPVATYHSTRRHKHEDMNLRDCNCENFRPHILNLPISQPPNTPAKCSILFMQNDIL
jgi:hypothetical protein